jgi:hypothetical protein
MVILERAKVQESPLPDIHDGSYGDEPTKLHCTYHVIWLPGNIQDRVSVALSYGLAHIQYSIVDCIAPYHWSLLQSRRIGRTLEMETEIGHTRSIHVHAVHI